MQAIFDASPQAALSGLIVWLRMLAGEDEEAARDASALCPDPRIRHFYDPDRRLSRPLAEALGGRGKVAWDVYIVYGPEARWEDGPPSPAAWMHQLYGSDWAGPDRYHAGEDLRRILEEAVAAARENVG